MQCRCVTLLLCTFQIISIYAAVTWEFDGAEFKALAYDGLPWSQVDSQPPTGGMRLVIPLDTPYSSFNPCDESSFTIEALKPLVHHINSSSLPWVGLIRDVSIQAACGRIPSQILFASYIAAVSEMAGASAVIWVGANGFTHSTAKFQVPPNVNISSRRVHHMTVTIPLLTLGGDSLATRLPVCDFFRLQNISSASAIPSCQGLFVSSLVPDANPYDNIFKGVTFYRLAMLLLSCFSLLCIVPLSAHAAFISLQDDKAHNPSSRYVRQTMASRVVKVVLAIATLCAAICLCLIGIDPVGCFFIFDYFLGKLFLQTASDLALMADLGTIVYLCDMYVAFKMARKLRVATPLLVRYRYAVVLIFAAALIITAADLTSFYLTLNGQLGSNVDLGPAAINVSLHLVCNLVLMRLIALFKRQIILVVNPTIDSTVEAADRQILISPSPSMPEAPVIVRTSKPATKTARELKKQGKMMRRFVRLERWINISIVARFVLIMDLSLIGMEFHLRGPLAYTVMLLALGYAFAVFLTAQVLATRIRIIGASSVRNLRTAPAPMVPPVPVSVPVNSSTSRHAVVPDEAGNVNFGLVAITCNGGVE